MQKMTKKTKLTQKSNKNLSSDLPPENLDNGQVGVIQQSLSGRLYHQKVNHNLVLWDNIFFYSYTACNSAVNSKQAEHKEN